MQEFSGPWPDGDHGVGNLRYVLRGVLEGLPKSNKFCPLFIQGISTEFLRKYSKDASRKILSLNPDDAVVGIGGSTSMGQRDVL